MKNIIICTSSFDKKNINKSALPKDLEIKFNPFGRKLKEKELLNMVNKETVGLVSGTEKINEKILIKAPNLKVISRCGTGTDNIDSKVLKKKRLKIFTTDKEPTGAVAEFVLTQILATLKNTYIHNLYLKEKKWKKIKGEMLSSKKVGLIGYGKIGKKISQLLKPFKCKIFIYDPKIKIFSNKKVLNEIIKKCEIITLNIPYNKRNKNFINFSKLSLMRSDTILVNCSRGGLIDERAMYKKLLNNPQFRVILDCFDDEPYYGKLIKLNNTLLSPHVASFTNATRNLMEKNSFLNCLKNIK